MFLGLDLGTGSVKAVVVDDRGALVAHGSAAVELRHVGVHGVEQDIEGIWAGAIAAISSAGRQTPLREIRAVGVSSQGGALQVLDPRGAPLGPVVSWMDGRGRPWDDRITERLGGDWFAAHTGHGTSGLAVGQILRLRETEPDLLRHPRAVGFVGDHVVSRLCGRRAHDATSLSVAVLYNPGLGRADPDLLGILDLDEGRLPDLLAPTTPAGALLPSVALATGLRPGIPVSAAIHDQYAAALGCGAVEAGDVMLGAGTAWVLVAVRGPGPGALRPVVADAFACPHVVEGRYAQMLAMVNGGSALDWVLRLTAREGLAGPDLDALLETVPAGCAGLRVRPRLVSGAASHGSSDDAGRIEGLRLYHTPAHLIRAVVEGLAMELARHLDMLRAGGQPPRRILVCGGGAGGAVTPRCIADVTSLPIVAVAERAVSARGAAIVARAIAEGGSDLGGIAARMPSPARPVEPGPDAVVYRGLTAAYLQGWNGRGR